MNPEIQIFVSLAPVLRCQFWGTLSGFSSSFLRLTQTQLLTTALLETALAVLPPGPRFQERCSLALVQRFVK